MDTTPGTTHCFSISCLPNFLAVDVPARSTVRLPYSLVPGISINSPLFLKAVSTIAKQQSETPATLLSTSDLPADREKPFPNFGIGRSLPLLLGLVLLSD